MAVFDGARCVRCRGEKVMTLITAVPRLFRCLVCGHIWDEPVGDEAQARKLETRLGSRF
jgi:hypothetical protein